MLRIQAGEKIDGDADSGSEGDEPTPARVGALRTLSVRATLMTPVKPMLASACKSYEAALKR